MPKSFDYILRNEPEATILNEYSRLIHCGRVHTIIAINTIGVQKCDLHPPILCKLIVTTAAESTPELLEKILEELSSEFRWLGDHYIIEYIGRIYQLSEKYARVQFRILWDAYTRNIPPSMTVRLNILSYLIRKLQYIAGMHYAGILIWITRIIIEQFNETIPEIMHESLFRIACYDKTLEFLTELNALGCHMSKHVQLRQVILLEFIRVQRSIDDIRKIVDWLFDESVSPIELYPFYAWVIVTKHTYDCRIAQYLMDIGVRIPISRKEFFKLVYNKDNFKPDNAIFMLLNDVFDSRV